MTPQPQPQTGYLLITREELEELWTQCESRYFDEMFHRINVRPAPSPHIDVSKCFEDIVYSSSPWKIYRQDAGMGEHDYAVFLNDVFFCRTEHSQTAHEIIRAIRGYAGQAEAAAQAREELRLKYVEFMNHPCPQLADKYNHCCDVEYCGLCILDEVLESLRTGGERK